VPAWPPPITITSNSAPNRIALNPQGFLRGRVL
jgi:hypothetical protein